MWGSSRPLKRNSIYYFARRKINPLVLRQGYRRVIDTGILLCVEMGPPILLGVLK